MSILYKQINTKQYKHKATKREVEGGRSTERGKQKSVQRGSRCWKWEGQGRRVRAEIGSGEWELKVDADVGTEEGKGRVVSARGRQGKVVDDGWMGVVCGAVVGHALAKHCLTHLRSRFPRVGAEKWRRTRRTRWWRRRSALVVLAGAGLAPAPFLVGELVAVVPLPLVVALGRPRGS